MGNVCGISTTDSSLFEADEEVDYNKNNNNNIFFYSAYTEC